MRKVWALALTGLLAACGTPRIDTSSNGALQESIQEVSRSLSGEDRDAFDELVALARRESSAPDFLTGKPTPMTTLMQPVHGMTGKEMLAFWRGQDAVAKEEAAHQQTDALDALESINRSIVLADPVFLTATTMRATISNNLTVTLAEIDFVYQVRTRGRAMAWQEGDGFFSIDGGLEPGETRELVALPLGLRLPQTNFALAGKAVDEHPGAQVILTITGAKGADKKPILSGFAFLPSDELLDELRQRLPPQ
ncbi:MAG: DUF6694 family lipoprotein [Lysobacteraceae bacterium]